jgi:hypothetical protein
MGKSKESVRLDEYREKKSNWKLWGPYLSERSWGTVREDYSEDGTAWEFFPHDHARSKAYRWGEDGIAGISDRNQYLCFALSFWNGKDGILKERMFGLTSNEGNHGEDVKDYYYYLDSTPTHSYMKCLYKYSHKEFPYAQLVAENKARTKEQTEFELCNTGIFNDGSYFDCYIEYAKSSEADILIQITIKNRSANAAPIAVIPTLWFRNTWNWGYPKGPMGDVDEKPHFVSLPEKEAGAHSVHTVQAVHSALGMYYLYVEDKSRNAEILHTENETNAQRLYGLPNRSPYTKDAFHHYVVNSQKDAVNPNQTGTKVGALFKQNIEGNGEVTFKLRLSKNVIAQPFAKFDEILQERITDADEFYGVLQNPKLNDDEKKIQRQAAAGMLWTKQLYYYDIEQWLHGDPGGAVPPAKRQFGRNRDWKHLTNYDIISMPDKWEFPWYAAWDLAFHCIPFSLIDPDFAKRQLELMTREWYMHPNGALPAYEWAFGDVNPPVHAWAVWRVYKIQARYYGEKDFDFLEGVFHKLLLNFTWWVNQKDVDGNNIFQGGFLGLDNIGIFDRSRPLPTGGHLDQADGTSWMAAYCLWMMKISLELAERSKVYQDLASKFLEHFLRVANAMTNIGGTGRGLWDETDGFFYDVLHLPNGDIEPLRVRSMVGLMPLVAVDTIEPETLERFPDFKRRLKWFMTNRPHLSGNMARIDVPGIGKRRLASLLTQDRLVRVLTRLFDEDEFLSGFGIRSLSKYHEKNPFVMNVNGDEYTVKYEPGESTTFLFGGNSNWRGPVWFPVNILLIEALQRYHRYYGAEFKVEYPTGSGVLMTLSEIATDISRRLMRPFVLNKEGNRSCLGTHQVFTSDPHFKENILFHEYYHAETGQGLGASHQTGWTGLVGKLFQQAGGVES